MAHQTFTHQLVMRRDTRSGLVCVGWARDMPLERYQHITLIVETPRAEPLHPAAECYPLYENACQQARALNHDTLAQQRSRHIHDGWLQVPLELRATQDSEPDNVGSYQQAAMQALHRLTRNVTEVWAAIDGAHVIDLSARIPPRPMQAVEFHVWRQQVIQRLHTGGETVLPGKLIVTHSGLWFRPEEDAV